MIKEIQCFDDKMGSAEQAITQYCFVTGTFTVPGRCLLWLMKMALILEDLIEDSMQSNDHDFIWVDEDSLKPITKYLYLTGTFTVYGSWLKLMFWW